MGRYHVWFFDEAEEDAWIVFAEDESEAAIMLVNEDACSGGLDPFQPYKVCVRGSRGLKRFSIEAQRVLKFRIKETTEADEVLNGVPAESEES
jgi:hypothetical protein